MFKAYYLKKKAQGKRHRNIIGHVTKKLMRVIYSILKNNSSYILVHCQEIVQVKRRVPFLNCAFGSYFPSQNSFHTD